jgi:hypothetical protein
MQFHIGNVVQKFKAQVDNNDIASADILEPALVLAHVPHRIGQQVVGRKGDDNFFALTLNSFTLKAMRDAAAEIEAQAEHPLHSVFSATKHRKFIDRDAFMGVLEKKIKEKAKDVQTKIQPWFMEPDKEFIISDKSFRALLFECAGVFLDVCGLAGTHKLLTQHTLTSLFGTGFLPVHKKPVSSSSKKQKI